ncbi:MAG: hypothetical protein IM568_11835, partial [Flavobacterium sp.]|nr:hypothetical protein [Flavobacterium sp.]
MSSSTPKNTQICCTVTPEITDFIKNAAEKDNRSISQMAGILLSQAIKEKIRLQE